MKLGQFTQAQLRVALTKFKNRDAAGLVKMLPEVWKTMKCEYILLRFYNALYNQNTIDGR